MTVAMDIQWEYLPISLRIINSSTKNKLFGFSGIYLVSKIHKLEYIISLTNLSNEFKDYKFIESYLTCQDLINTSNNDETINWFKCKITSFIEVKNTENPLISFLNKEGLNSNFEFTTTNNNNKSNNIDNTASKQATSILILKPINPILTKLISINANFKKFNFVNKYNSHNNDAAITGKLPIPIELESCPFGLSTVTIFSGFKMFGFINYKDSNDELYLSDTKYLDNMIGGLANLNKYDHHHQYHRRQNQHLLNNYPHASNPETTDSLGLIYGSLKKSNGQGELMVILSWKFILNRLNPILSSEISHKLNTNHLDIQSVNAQYNDNIPALIPNKAISYIENSSNVNFNNTNTHTSDSIVGISVTNKNGLKFWGSGVVLSNNMVVTNKHVIFEKMESNEIPAKIEIWFNNGENKLILSNDEIKLNENIFLPFNDYKVFDLCFIKISLENLSNFKIKNSVDLMKQIEQKNSNKLNFEIGDLTKSLGFGLFFNPDGNNASTDSDPINEVISLRSTNACGNNSGSSNGNDNTSIANYMIGNFFRRANESLERSRNGTSDGSNSGSNTSTDSNARSLSPLESIGYISKIVNLNNLNSMVISSSSCWSGSSGGGVFYYKNIIGDRGEMELKELFLGIMVSNGRLNNGETLNNLNLIIPIDVILLGLKEISNIINEEESVNYNNEKLEKLDYLKFKDGNVEFSNTQVKRFKSLWSLREVYTDVFTQSSKL
ncbi:unnamed protein product [[Candida] boidinii]|uniref:Unnamed protein product n=1 Tax=Candida boidinii TaxID=5477 RepID=A0A9W6SXH1_CANBO|nr:hypothetical protein B5S30_g3996 [[Candida] boidinii]GME69191.1 unnamed protein product [[Candida] boidinii]